MSLSIFFLVTIFTSIITFANPFGDLSKELNKVGDSLNKTAEQVKTPPPAPESPAVPKPDTMDLIKKRAEQAKDIKATADDIVKARDELKAEKKEREDQGQNRKNERLNKVKEAFSTGKKTYEVVSKAKARKDERKPASEKKQQEK